MFFKKTDKILRQGAAAVLTLAQSTGKQPKLWGFPPLSPISRVKKWQDAQPSSRCLCNCPDDSHQKQLYFVLLVFGVHKSLRRVPSPSTTAIRHLRSRPEIISGAEVKSVRLDISLKKSIFQWFRLVRSKCDSGEETSTL